MEQLDQQIGLSLTALKQADEQPSREWKVYLAALEYIKCGYYIVPLEKGTKKLPRMEFHVNYGSASKKKATIEKWFHPDHGRFKGWNIGIACGRNNGVFAIDIDVHGEDDGFINWAKLETKHGAVIRGPEQKTPNDGSHLLFQWQPNAACTTNKIAKAIDTRGGDENSCKGHVVVWPSVVDGKQYTWVRGGELPIIPQWVMERMGVMWKPPKYGRGNENIGADDLEQTISEDQIKNMLSFIDVNDVDYDTWLRVGMAIKSQYPDGDGLEIWDSWSRQGNRYKAGECKIRWNGFSLSGSVRAGSLFHYAKEGGWQADPINEEKSGNRLDELVAKMNIEYAVVSVGGKIRILKEKEAEHTMMMHYDLLDKDSFRTLLQNETLPIMDQNNGKIKNVTVADIWLGHEFRRTYPNGMGLYPGKSPQGYYNTWNGFSVTPRLGECSIFYEHIRQVICDGNEKIYIWVMDWLADLIQNPDDPKGCAIVMRGGEGIGKGTFANAIGELFGPHYRHLIDDSHLTSNFNAHLLDAIVVFADEITWGGNKKTSGKLKGMVTERNLVGERKGIDAILYRNMIHMLIASNSDWVIPAGQDSRRWLVLDVPGTHANDVEYFNTIQDELENGGKEALIYDLMNREITSNLRHAPETKALQDQRILNTQQDTVLNWWVRCLTAEFIDIPDEREFEPEREGNENWPENVNKIALFDDYEEWCLKRNQRAISMNIFLKTMRSEFGFSESRIKVGEIRKRIIKIPPLEIAKNLINEKYENILGDKNESKD